LPPITTGPEPPITDEFTRLQWKWAVKTEFITGGLQTEFITSGLQTGGDRRISYLGVQ